MKLFKNGGFFHGTHKKEKRVLLSLLLAICLLGGTFFALAENLDIADTDFARTVLGISSERRTALGTSEALDISRAAASNTITLGESGVVEIRTADDLVELSQLVADGDTCEGTTYRLEADIDLSALDEWTPIGTIDHPFSGTFDGNNFVIRGVGSVEVPSLFGFLKGATLKNIQILSVKMVSSEDPYSGLFLRAENSTMINCIVKPAEPNYAMRLFASSSLPTDDSWRGSGEINTTAQLWDFAKTVAAGNTYSGQTIRINVTMTEEYNNGWIGIGVRNEGNTSNPFKGTASGTIRNFKPHNTALNDMGLFGYTEDATLANLTLEGVEVAGGDHVGALVGYAVNTRIENCSVSGRVSGVNSVGGLIGTYVATGGSPAESKEGTVADNPGIFEAVGSVPEASLSPINTVYSTADVEGFYQVGGLIGSVIGENYTYNGVEYFFSSVDPYDGLTTDSSEFNNPETKNMYIVNTAFTTGSVTGSIAVGGVVGHLGEIQAADHEDSGTAFHHAPVNQDAWVTVANVASSSSIQSAGGGGGIVGTVASDLVFGYSDLDSQVVQAYFSGTIQGYTHIGGLVGASSQSSIASSTSASNSYVSGFIVVPDAEADHVWYTSGANGTGDDTSINVWADPYALYSVSAPMQTVKKTTSTGGQSLGADCHWFDTGAVHIDGFSSNGGITYTNGYPSGTSKFPSLTAFTSGPAAFQTFDTISTNPNLRALPLYMECGSTGNLERVGNGGNTPMTLDTANGLVEWTINGGSDPVTTEDLTLKDKVNTLSMKNNSLALKEKANKEFTFELAYKVPSLNMVNRQMVTVQDETVRPLYDSAYQKFHKTAGEAKSSATAVSVKDYRHFVEFPESIKGNGLTLTLKKYDAGFTNQTGGSQTIPSTDVKIISDNVLRFDFTNVAIQPGENFNLEITAGGLEDHTGAANETISLFFRTASNQPPEIVFDPSLPIADHTTETEQMISLVENDSRYEGVYQGVTVEDDLDYLEIMDDSITTIELVTPHAHTAAGKDGYPQTVTLDNFTSIPGEYKVKYTIEDSDGVVSQPAYRTYKIRSEAKVMQGGQPYKILRIALSDQEVIDIYNRGEKNGTDMATELDKEIHNRYVTSASDKQVTAYYYTSECTKENLSIEFKTAPYLGGTTDFLDGLETVATFTTSDGEEHMYILSLASLEPTLEIQLDKNVYVTENTFNGYKARQHFGAKVYNKETGQIEKGHNIYYDFKSVDLHKKDIPQEVLISLSKDPVIVAGVDVTVYTKATVTISRVNKWIHPEDKPTTPVTVWEEINDRVRSGKDNKEYNLTVDYDSMEYTPTDFSLIVANKENVTANLKLPSDITLTVDGNKVDKSRKSGMLMDLRIERSYDMLIDRDAKGLGTHQFTSAAEVALPGTITVSMPLDERVQDAETLYLYRIDPSTREYILIKELESEEYADDTLTLEMTKFQGEYVVTEAVLKNLTASN